MVSELMVHYLIVVFHDSFPCLCIFNDCLTFMLFIWGSMKALLLTMQIRADINQDLSKFGQMKCSSCLFHTRITEKYTKNTFACWSPCEGEGWTVVPFSICGGLLNVPNVLRKKLTTRDMPTWQDVQSVCFTFLFSFYVHSQFVWKRRLQNDLLCISVEQAIKPLHNQMSTCERWTTEAFQRENKSKDDTKKTQFVHYIKERVKLSSYNGEQILRKKMELTWGWNWDNCSPQTRSILTIKSNMIWIERNY